jgi:tetratricopeptide (TPR) repeat protein
MIGLFAANQTLLSAASPVNAQETMRTANQLYETAQYAQAVQAYEQLSAQGYGDSALFYNLGNAYYKQGDYGRAILNYRRAQRLDPRDPDIEANLALARAQAVDQFEAADSGGLLNQVGQAAQGLLTLNEVAMAALGAWIAFILLLILFSTARRKNLWHNGLKYSLVVAAIVLVVGVLALGSYLYADSGLSTGVIVAAEVDVTSGPGLQYVTEFTLHDGAEVELVEVRENWVRLALPGDELEGWVPANAVEAVAGQL